MRHFLRMTILAVVLHISSATARPADELLLRKCTSCHTSTRWETSCHTGIGWWWLTARMRWINGAALDWAEHAAVVDSLAFHFPARNEAAREEWALAGIFVIPLIGLPVWLIFRQRRRKWNSTE